ncbi:MAG: 2-phosphosulfolactate phosphatase [Dehalococcoidia bacterium]
MKLGVALTPRLMREPRRHAVAVVDVLRATSSLVTMFERGLLRALISDSLRDARQLALRNFSLLCGEAKMLPIAGFDYGNSPAEFDALSLKGKSAVLWTTNGTKALGAAAESPAVIAAALLNRRAAARRLLEEARTRQLDAMVLCAGLDRGVAFSLEDTVTAGAIVEAARETDPEVELTDEAWSAYHLWRWYDGDALRAFGQASHGRALLTAGFGGDLRFAAQVDAYEMVPVLYDEDGVKTMRARPREKRAKQA